MSDALDQLARLHGLGEAYYDHRGELKYFSGESRRAILHAMGLPVNDPTALQQHLDKERQRVPFVSPVADASLSCYEPEFLRSDARCWGVSVQLYTLRSAQNWGIGDFADLRELIALAAPLGCDLIGLNPLHALFPNEPERFSPYSPSSRLFLNVLCIAVPDIPEFATCEAVRDWFAHTDVQDELTALRANGVVQYPRVAALKLRALRFLHAAWSDQADLVRYSQYRKYVDERGESLRLHATFDALDEYFHAQSPSLAGWLQWPPAYRDPGSAAVKEFAAKRADDIDFYRYLQWLADSQLEETQSYARAQGMRVGLYGDLAVGASPDGSEVWSNQALCVTQAAVGAPPDPLAVNGQDWGIPPMSPRVLQAQAFRPFVDLLRANMRHAGALRIDHVMSLFRLWWVPRGFSATQGVYVHYPLEVLCALLAEESHREKCLAIGEDLGTVPDEVRHAMAKYRLYHYNVLLFEKRGDQFKLPHEYVRNAIATATTHDLPPLKAWWQGDDIELRERLGVYRDAETARQLYAERDSDRRALLSALTGVGLWQWQAQQPTPEFSFALASALHLYLSKSQAALVLVQLEDLIGMTDPVNVPGTHTEHANWQRKLALATQGIFEQKAIRESLVALNRSRSSS